MDISVSSLELDDFTSNHKSTVSSTALKLPLLFKPNSFLKINSTPWINDGICSLVRNCRQAEKKTTQLLVHYTHMKNLMALLNQRIKVARSAYFNYLITTDKHNQNEKWVGLSGMALKWFSSYLSNLKFSLSVDNMASTLCSSGVWGSPGVNPWIHFILTVYAPFRLLDWPIWPCVLQLLTLMICNSTYPLSLVTPQI